MLCIKDAQLSYQNKVIFRDLKLQIKTGEWLVILGRSGVGKTSLLRIIAGLHAAFPEQNTEAHVVIDWAGSSELKKNVAYMAQQDGLLPWVSLLGNVLLPAHLNGDKADKSRALSWLNAVGLGAYSQYKPPAVSGGMRQRVALARTLMQNKPILLMDEPCSALDALTRLEMQQLLFKRVRAANKTVLMVTHDPWEALRLADRIIVLAGAPAEINYSIDLPATQNLRELDVDLLKYYAELLKALAV